MFVSDKSTQHVLSDFNQGRPVIIGNYYRYSAKGKKSNYEKYLEFTIQYWEGSEMIGSGEKKQLYWCFALGVYFDK